MDVLAAAEGRISSDDDQPPALNNANGGGPRQDATPDTRNVEENKFQKAIAVWRGNDNARTRPGP